MKVTAGRCIPQVLSLGLLDPRVLQARSLLRLDVLEICSAFQGSEARL